jgi:hypothetical protein
VQLVENRAGYHAMLRHREAAQLRRPLIFIYYREDVGRRSLAKLLTRNAARRIAAGIAKLPQLLRQR